MGFLIFFFQERGDAHRYVLFTLLDCWNLRVKFIVLCQDNSYNKFGCAAVTNNPQIPELKTTKVYFSLMWYGCPKLSGTQAGTAAPIRMSSLLLSWQREREYGEACTQSSGFYWR